MREIVKFLEKVYLERHAGQDIPFLPLTGVDPNPAEVPG